VRAGGSVAIVEGISADRVEAATDVFTRHNARNIEERASGGRYGRWSDAAEIATMGDDEMRKERRTHLLETGDDAKRMPPDAEELPRSPQLGGAGHDVPGRITRR
jgi:hypothetical protein